MKFIILLMCLPLSALALETDNYLSWGRELPESRNEINNIIKEKINQTLELSEGRSCEQVTMDIAWHFKTTPLRKLFEDWTTESLSHHMYPETPMYLQESIYRNTLRFYKKMSGLSPNLQVNGIYFGVDKLSHFGSTGRRYLKEYLKLKAKGLSEEEATKGAIRLGLDNEATILGIWAAGVFSYGDMEANYQGFRFYKKLCLDEKDTYLAQEGKKWILKNTPDIKEFINPYWDETYNLSFRAPGTWGHVKFIIKDEYCPMLNHSGVINRKAYYDSLSQNKSFSLAYIRKLQEEGYYRAPVPEEQQSLEQLCSEQ